MSSHAHAYLICENKCLVEGVPKEQYNGDMNGKISRGELDSETWTFVLEDGSTITKEVTVWTSQK